MAHNLTLPASIIIGGALMGVGLYFGLKSSDAAPQTANSPATAAPTAEKLSPQSSPPASQPAAPGESSDARKRIEAEVAKAIAALKPEWRKKCWAPAVKTTPEPSTSQYTLNLSFNPDGSLVASSWNEIRGASRTDVVQCLRYEPLLLKVTAPGVPIGLDMPVDLP